MKIELIASPEQQDKMIRLCSQLSTSLGRSNVESASLPASLELDSKPIVGEWIYFIIVLDADSSKEWSQSLAAQIDAIAHVQPTQLNQTSLYLKLGRFYLCEYENPFVEAE